MIKSLFRGDIFRHTISYPTIFVDQIDKFLSASTHQLCVELRKVLEVPKKYGGAGLQFHEISAISEILGEYDLGTCLYIGSHQSLGSKPLLYFGNDQLQQKYLPKLVSGKQLACFALTEESSGSDIKSLSCTAKTNSSKTEYILNGEKYWISNGDKAEFFTVFAKVDDNKDFSAFLVERRFGGVHTSIVHKQIGLQNFQNAVVKFENTPIPCENLISTLHGGYEVVLQVLTHGRSQLSAALCGTMKMLIEKCSERAKIRMQFGKRLIDWQDIQFKIAKMEALHFVSKAMVQHVTDLISNNEKEAILESAATKIFTTECAFAICDETVQIFGGLGCSEITGLGKTMMDLRIMRIIEGTNDVLRFYISLIGFKDLSDHLKTTYGSPFGALKTFLSKLSFGPGVFHNSLLKEENEFKRMVSAFSFDIAITLLQNGEKIKENQIVCRHLADQVISLFGIYCILQKYSVEVSYGDFSSLPKFRFAFSEMKTRYKMSQENYKKDLKLNTEVEKIISTRDAI